MATKLLLRALMAGGLAFALSGCGPTGNPLIGDWNESSRCPPNGCAGLEPDPAQLTITNGNRTLFYMTAKLEEASNGFPTGDRRCDAGDSCDLIDAVEFGGECYASTYPNNRIEVVVYQGSTSVPIQLASTDIVTTRATSPITVPRCLNGRWGIAINGKKLPGGYMYRVVATIRGIAADGTESPRNASSGSLAVQVSR